MPLRLKTPSEEPWLGRGKRSRMFGYVSHILVNDCDTFPFLAHSFGSSYRISMYYESSNYCFNGMAHHHITSPQTSCTHSVVIRKSPSISSNAVAKAGSSKPFTRRTSGGINDGAG